MTVSSFGRGMLPASVGGDEQGKNEIQVFIA
jgi:hypothetical protein